LIQEHQNNPKNPLRNLRRLIRVLRAGLCARAGACGGGRRRHPPSLKSPNAILELSDAKFAGIFGVISTGGGHEESMFSPSRDEYGMKNRRFSFFHVFFFKK
jgi:hypothetical protein